MKTFIKRNLTNRNWRSAQGEDEPHSPLSLRGTGRAAVTLLSVGLILASAEHALAAVRYVDVNSATPLPPFTSWETAARTIQEAIDVAVASDEIVVSNGVYATGGRAVHGTMTNRVAVDKPMLTLRSVNGPKYTIIQGHQVSGTTNGEGAIRCVYLTNGATLSGFTLTNGATQITNDDYPLYHKSGGGGLHCETRTFHLDPQTVVSNCVITGNSAFGPGGGAYAGGANSSKFIDCTLSSNTTDSIGGGVSGGLLSRCLIADNAARAGGGAANAPSDAGAWAYYSCTLDNCLLVGNRAETGGGAYSCELNNCTVTGNHATGSGGGLFGMIIGQVQDPSRAVNSIVYSNTAAAEENFADRGCNLENSCTIPLPSWGTRNITLPPLFVDFANGDFRLRSDSPCINAGTNSYVAAGAVDFDGNPRIVAGAVDMGAYEFQSLQPSLLIAPAGTNIQLVWPLWASDFDLQQTYALPSSPGDWSGVAASPVITNNQNAVILPRTVQSTLFRLFKSD